MLRFFSESYPLGAVGGIKIRVVWRADAKQSARGEAFPFSKASLRQWVKKREYAHISLSFLNRKYGKEKRGWMS